MKVLPYGERALLCEIDDHRDVPGLRDAAAHLDGIVDAVAGARTLLVTATPDASLSVLTELLTALHVAPAQEGEAHAVVLDVRYDGPDLDVVARLSGLSRDEVIAVHSGAEYVVRFCGFAPGFAYLDGLDQRLQVPRRDDPRTTVPAGSVAVADEFAGVYPSQSPGGWRLLGRTDAKLWDVDRDPPALLTPGTVVHFVPT